MKTALLLLALLAGLADARPRQAPVPPQAPEAPDACRCGTGCPLGKVCERCACAAPKSRPPRPEGDGWRWDERGWWWRYAAAPTPAPLPANYSDFRAVGGHAVEAFAIRPAGQRFPLAPAFAPPAFAAPARASGGC